MGKTRIFELDHTGYGGLCMDLVGRAIAMAKGADIYVPSDGELKVLRNPAYEQTIKILFAGNFGEEHGRSTSAQHNALFRVMDKYGLSGDDDVNKIVVRGARESALMGLGEPLREYEFVANARGPRRAA